MNTECLNYSYVPNKVMRADELTKSSSMCIWGSDHVCCKHTSSSMTPLVIPLATPLWHRLLPDLCYCLTNTLQVLSPPLPPPFPLFLCRLLTFLACQLGKRGCFISAWFPHVMMCCCSWYTKGLFCGTQLMMGGQSLP